MDKMTEHPNLISLISSNKPESGARKQAANTEGDSFSKVLEKKTGKTDEAAEKSRETIASDKPTEKGREKSKDQVELEERLKARLNGKPGEMSMANYIYNIVLQNPDALSLSEKQAFKVGEFSNEAIDASEFKKMLGERGLDLKNLNLTQLAQLAQTTNKAQVTAFLDELVKKQRHDEKAPEGAMLGVKTDDSRPEQAEKERKTAEARGTESARTEETSPQPRFDLVSESQRPQSTETSSRKEEREKVIAQIIERMEIQNVGRRTELTLKLNPEYLGEMRVKLSSENGKLEASFETTSREVRQFIEEGWEGLRDTFTRKGLNLQKVTATLVESVT
ncbi:MAG: flagellar hook-length control protein FliK [Proteobacteria bacterium]|nr:flagellar hook-length control protein FliK [Pseudomonadota bacterium]